MPVDVVRDLLIAKEEQSEPERLRGTFQVLDGNILMLVHPSSGDNKFYKVRDASLEKGKVRALMKTRQRPV